MLERDVKSFKVESEVEIERCVQKSRTDSSEGWRMSEQNENRWSLQKGQESKRIRIEGKVKEEEVGSRRSG